MGGIVNKSFSSPEETRAIDKGRVEIVDLSGAQVMRATFEPGQQLPLLRGAA